MARRCARESEGSDFRNSGRKRISTSATVGRRRESGGEARDRARSLRLTRQALTKRLDQRAGVFAGLMGHMKVGHRCFDLLVAQQTLDAVQARAAFDHVGGEGMAQGMDGGIGNAKFLAGDDEQSLERGLRHGGGGQTHSGFEFGSLLDTTPDIGKNQKRMPVESIIGAQILQHVGGDGNHAVLETLALANA